MAILAAALLGIELLFLPLAGIQADEILFVAPFLKGTIPLYSWHQIPIMCMDYIGSLKSWLYFPIFQLWHFNVWSIRLPPSIFSLATLMIFGDTVRRVAGASTALFATLCLATTSTFIFTNVYDWGPVALLLLGLAACLNLLQRYSESGGVGYLGGAFLVAGVSTWYKAIFVFPFTALLVALAVVYFRELQISRRTVSCAVICFAVGVSPLIAFNISHRGATVRAATYIGSAPPAEKALMMARTLDGRALEHYMFRSYPRERIPLNGAPLPDLVTSWYRGSELGPGSALPVLLLVSLFVFPFLRKLAVFRPLLVAWIASATTFGLMLVFRDAGAGPHHTVLVILGPAFIVAATLTAMGQRTPRSFRPILALAAFGLVASNVYLLSRYYAEARQNGFSVYWTDASPELAHLIEAQSLPAAFLDWGIGDVVRVESGDRIALADDGEPRQGVLYVGHCRGYVIDENRMETFERKLVASGLRWIEVAKISDQHGEPVFCAGRLL